VPEIPVAQGTRLLLLTYALVIGLGQLANAPPAVRDVIEGDPEFAAFAIDFRTELETSLERLIRGWAPDAG
jgi:hypothetical protein